MSFNTFYPPYKAKVVGESNKVTPAWRTFFNDVFNTVGGASGDVVFFSNSILSLDSNTLILPSGGFQIKNITLPQSVAYTTPKVVTQTASTMQFSSLTDLGLSPLTGQVIPSISNSHDGWLKMDDGTIGDASSGATTRANSDVESLFILLWNQVSDTYAPVSGGRGVSAQADWDASKTITLVKVLGRILCAAGESTVFEDAAQGVTFGAEEVAVQGLWVMTTGGGPEIFPSTYPSHDHTLTIYKRLGAGGSSLTYESGFDELTDIYVGYNPLGPSFGAMPTDDSKGGFSEDNAVGDAHNNMMKTCFLNYFIKL